MSASTPVQREVFDTALAAIRARFPELRCTVDREHEHLHVAAEFPAQPGLDFAVHLNLQNRDELHLYAENLWVEWFPCQNEGVRDDYVDAVTGLIAGEYRMLETLVMGRVATVRLQRPTVDGGWRTIASSTRSFTLSALIPWKRTRRVVRNGARPATPPLLAPAGPHALARGGAPAEPVQSPLVADDDPARLEVLDAALAAIRARFPALHFTTILREEDSALAEVEFPVQPGLDFVVRIGVEHEEFFVACGTLWHGHFSCQGEDDLDGYVATVTGLLSGECRILVHSTLGRDTTARLQRPAEGGGWRTVQTLGSFWALLPWKRTRRVVRNGARPISPPPPPQHGSSSAPRAG